ARLQQAGLIADDQAMRSGLAAARIPGRLERLRECPLLLLDAAHNPDGARALVRALQSLYLREGRSLILILGLSEAHQPEEMAAILAPVANQVIATASLHAQATPAARVAELVGRVVPAEACSIIKAVPEAVAAALATA